MPLRSPTPWKSQDWEEREGFELGLDELFEREWEATRAPFIVADLETTAAPDESGAEILEFAALLVGPAGEIIAEFSQLVSITGMVPTWLLAELDLTLVEIARQGHSLREAMTSFPAFVGMRPVFVHGASFDEPFLRRAAELCNQTFDRPLHDTLLISQLTWPELRKHSMVDQAIQVGVSPDMPRALDYAKATLAVLMSARDLAHGAGDQG